MINISLPWKGFSINLSNAEKQMKAIIGDNYIGCSANYSLVLHLKEEPTKKVKDSVQKYWDSLSEDSDEATSYKSADEIRDRIEELRAQIPSKSWNQLNVAQRKMVVGQTPTQEELWA